jgi:hypothetical protein
MKTSIIFKGLYGFPRAAVLGLFLLGAAGAFAATPTLTKIDPPERTDLTKNSLTVTLTGTGFSQKDPAGQSPTLVITPAGMVTATNIAFTSDTAGTATFNLSNSAMGTVQVKVHTASFGDSGTLPWDTGVAVNDCIESLASGQCEIRIEVDVTGISNAGSQTGANTAPNIMTKLDWQI